MASGVTTASVLDKISQGHLECTICFNRFQTPKVLACSHCFCYACLKEIVSSKSGSSGVLGSSGVCVVLGCSGSSRRAGPCAARAGEGAVAVCSPQPCPQRSGRAPRLSMGVGCGGKCRSSVWRQCATPGWAEWLAHEIICGRSWR